MANRVYLYSVDQKPTRQNRDSIRIRGISEWSDTIPLSYLMLVSANPVLSNSVIWDKRKNIAILGEYDNGLQNLRLLLDLIRESKVQFPEIFERNATDTYNFLESVKHRQKYILFEPAELFEMSSNIADQTRLIIDDIDEILSAIKEKNIQKINDYLGEDITTHWEDLLGINNWTDTLYFDLTQK